ncbi:LrgB family protein [Propionigenium maris]|nr:LrgB family protein [Propionigenium maris]
MEITSHPLFGIILTLGTFEIGKRIYNKFRLPILNPILIAILLIVGVLMIFKIPLESYESGSKMLSLFLGPVTVILAVPLYKQLDLLRSHLFPILIGVTVGAITSIATVIILGKVMGLERVLLLSMAPKSITTPIGMELSKNIGGIQAITIVGIMITGITGAVAAPIICEVFRIKNRVAKGIGVGVSSHAVGTSKAIEMGEVEGAMSGLAIGLTGVATIIVLPMVLKVLYKFLI